MNEITQLETGFAAMSREDIQKIRSIREALKEELVANPDAEVEIPCEQHLHAGFYSRTIFIPKDTVAVGVTILKDTQLVISGHVLMNDGTHVVEIDGYRVLECKAGRAQIARTFRDNSRLVAGILYRWNRDYPGDERFCFPGGEEIWQLDRWEDFPGFSHEKITEEIYIHKE